jgi:hypothetical protein
MTNIKKGIIMAQKSRDLLDILQDAETALNLKPEELGKLLLDYLDGSQEIRLESFTSYRGLFEMIDSSYKLSEDRKREMRRRYPRDRDEAVLCALMEGWQWLLVERLVAPRPEMEREVRVGGVVPYFVTRLGKLTREASH